MASTPPPPTRIHTPPTPLHGARYDAWEPYSPRRSARVGGKRAQEFSSPPRTASRTHARQRSPAVVAATPISRKRTLARQISSQTLSPPSSPESALRRDKPADLVSEGSSQVNGLTLGLPTTHASGEVSSDLGDATAMFPTPRKTPRSKDSASRSSTARILHFRALPDDVLPTPRKRRQRITLDSPQQSPVSGVAIYTDSQDRVPEMEQSDDNPFVGPRRAPRGSQDRPNSRPRNQEEEAMDEAVKNDEGLIYVFRGRKVLKRYMDTTLEAEAEDPELHNMAGQSSRIRHMAGPAAHRPITRSSMKPRLLFPSIEHRQSADEADEEALTDIEEEASHRRVPSAIRDLNFEPVEPDVATTQRDDDMAEHESHSLPAPPKPGKAKKSSPFDSWPRQKPGARNTSQGTKRSAVEPAQATSSKRTRSSAHTA